MNRERSLSGSNGYGRELGIDVMAEISARARTSSPVRWLDLCCGSGRAPAEAAALLADRGPAGRVEIIGLDLVDHFVPGPSPRCCAWSAARWPNGSPTAAST